MSSAWEFRSAISSAPATLPFVRSPTFTAYVKKKKKERKVAKFSFGFKNEASSIILTKIK